MAVKIPVLRKVSGPALNLMSYFAVAFWGLHVALHPRGQLYLIGDLCSVLTLYLGSQIELALLSV